MEELTPPQKNKPVSAARGDRSFGDQTGGAAGEDAAPSGLSVGLLLSEVSNHGQLEHLALVRLQQQDNPNNEAAQPD